MPHMAEIDAQGYLDAAAHAERMAAVCERTADHLRKEADEEEANARGWKDSARRYRKAHKRALAI